MTTDDLLRRRARDLARPIEVTDSPATTRKLLRFRHRDTRYATPLGAVRQVVPLTGAARLPREAQPLVAIASVGGAIVPVVRLSPEDDRALMAPWGIAVEVAGIVLCLPADSVEGVTDIDAGDLGAGGATPVAGSEHAQGITPDGDLVLDLEAVIAEVTGHRSGSAGPDETEVES